MKRPWVHYVPEADVLFNALTLETLFVTPALAQQYLAGTIEDPAFQDAVARTLVIEDEQQFFGQLQQKVDTISLHTLYLVPTLQCNLRCRYCHIKTFDDEKMTFETAKKGIDYFLEHRAKQRCELVFYGGEPLLHKELVEQVSRYVRGELKLDEHQLEIILFTNGTVLDAQTAQWLKELGVFTIVSMDGPEAVHDRMRVTRGEGGSFKQVLAGYRAGVAAGVRVGISLVIGTHNCDQLPEAVEYLVDECQPVDLGLSTLHLTDNGSNAAFVPIAHVTRRMLDTLEMLKARGVYAEHLFRRVRPFVEKKLRLKDCPSCGSKLLVTPDAKVGVCEAYMGRDQFFWDLDGFDVHAQEEVRKWCGRAPAVDPRCQGCKAVGICGGGCPFDADVVTGSPYNPDVLRCEQSQLITAYLLGALREVVGDKLGAAGFYRPSMEERRALYGSIRPDSQDLPLRPYSESAEKHA